MQFMEVEKGIRDKYSRSTIKSALFFIRLKGNNATEVRYDYCDTFFETTAFVHDALCIRKVVSECHKEITGNDYKHINVYRSFSGNICTTIYT